MYSSKFSDSVSFHLPTNFSAIFVACGEMERKVAKRSDDRTTFTGGDEVCNSWLGLLKGRGRVNPTHSIAIRPDPDTDTLF
jgi:hypothetical protein